MFITNDFDGEVRTAFVIRVVRVVIVKVKVRWDVTCDLGSKAE